MSFLISVIPDLRLSPLREFSIVFASAGVSTFAVIDPPATGVIAGVDDGGVVDGGGLASSGDTTTNPPSTMSAVGVATGVICFNPADGTGVVIGVVESGVVGLVGCLSSSFFLFSSSSSSTIF